MESGKDMKDEVRKMRLKKAARDSQKRQKTEGVSEADLRQEQLGESLLSESEQEE